MTWKPEDLQPEDKPVLYVFYRLSDNSYKKPRLPGSTKEICLNNFLDAFPSDSYICLIADNCKSETIEQAINLITTHRMQPPYWMEEHITNLGNAGSFRKALEMACDLPNESLVYFVEDDYIHLKTHFKYQQLWDSPWDRGAFEIFQEGLTHLSPECEYVTLQDHPDKYGPNCNETSVVWRTQSTHWKQTKSTTMTFGSKPKWLKEDFDIWMKHTEGSHPNDHEAFIEICQKHDRKIASPIPGAAVHCDLSSSSDNRLHPMDHWVYRCIEDCLKKAIVYHDGDMYVDAIKSKEKQLNKLLPEGLYERLLVMQSIRMTQLSTTISKSEK